MPSMFFLLRSIISGLSSATASSRESSSIKESWPSREPELGGSVKTLSREALSKSVSFLNPAAPTSSEDWVSYLHGLPHVPQGTPGPGQLAQGVQAVQHLDNRSQQTTRGQKQRQMDYQETASTFFHVSSPLTSCSFMLDMCSADRAVAAGPAALIQLQPGVGDSYSNGHKSYSYSLVLETVTVIDTSRIVTAWGGRQLE